MHDNELVALPHIINRLPIGFAAIIILSFSNVACFNSSGAEDSWQHFSTGGVWSTNSGSMAPSGDSIACSLPDTGKGDVYRISRPSGRRTQLTTSHDYEAFPLFSASGEKIYYVRESKGSRHIWVMNSDGTGQKQVTSGRVLDDLVDVSPDEHHILIERSFLSGGRGRMATTYLVDLATPGGDPIKIGRYAKFIDSGRSVVVSPLGSNECIELLNLESGQTEKVGAGTLLATEMNGFRIAVIRTPIASEWQIDNDLWVIDVKSKEEKRIGRGHSPAFVPDGSELLYFQGFKCQTRCYSFEEDKVFDIEMPAGYKVTPTGCLDGSGCLIRVIGDDRTGVYYHYEKNTRRVSAISVSLRENE